MEERDRGRARADGRSLRAERRRWRALVDLLASLMVLLLFAGLTVGALMYFRSVLQHEPRRAVPQTVERIGSSASDVQEAPAAYDRAAPSEARRPEAADSESAEGEQGNNTVDRSSGPPAAVVSQTSRPSGPAGVAEPPEGRTRLVEATTGTPRAERRPQQAAAKVSNVPVSERAEPSVPAREREGDVQSNAPAESDLPAPKAGASAPVPRWRGEAGSAEITSRPAWPGGGWEGYRAPAPWYRPAPWRGVPGWPPHPMYRQRPHPEALPSR